MKWQRSPTTTCRAGLYHRYRYDVFPRERRLDSYPPYVQVEPTSICNFRCVFCYQIDETFSSRRSNMMGSMDLGLFREVVDEISGSVEFGSLASRGEPLICKDIDKMLAYTRGKFLNLKMNTNASLLNEAKCHAILSSGLGSLVFSADAAKEPDYSQFRVKGSLKTTLANVRLFQKIRTAHYPDSSLITRVSGVMYDPARQDMQEMVSFWGDLVDQVSFVEYNPWENVYEADASEISTPCSDLWRRFFLWYDGTTNPCDTDYKSLLSPGIFPNEDISSIWCGEPYERLRNQHLQGQRGECYPCRNCYVV